MGAPNTDGVMIDVQQVREILAEIDRAAVVDARQWAEKRNSSRQRFNTVCTVRYLAPDGRTVATVHGHTRDISVGGLGIVSHHHFRRGTALYISVASTGGQTRSLTGTVVYSRIVREGWYLTGVRFVPMSGKTVTPPAEEREPDEKTNPEKTGPGPTPEHSSPAGASDEDKSQARARERALRLLASASSAGVTSNSQIDKIVMLSSSGDHVIRRAAIPALMQITSAAGRLGLEALLRDPNSQIQLEAAEALGSIGAEASIEPLKELLTHKKPDVALRTAAVLGRLNDRSGLAVVRRYMSKGNPHARDAVRAFGVIVGRKFRLNDEGIEEASRYLKKL
ncbi:MAG: HEAT repeat domain-containing protein [Phycisphaerae bacterium]